MQTNGFKKLAAIESALARLKNQRLAGDCMAETNVTIMSDFRD